MLASRVVIGLGVLAVLLPGCGGPAHAAIDLASCDPSEVQVLRGDAIGLSEAKARALLRQQHYSGRVVTRSLYVQNPSLVGKVASINPHPGARVCGATELRLNIGKAIPGWSKSSPAQSPSEGALPSPRPPPPGLTQMPDLRGLRPSAVQLKLQPFGATPRQIEYIACEHRVAAIPAACDAQFRVVAQWPAAGDPVIPQDAPVLLHLERRDELFSSSRGLPDSPTAGVPAQCADPTALPAWTVTRDEPTPLPADVRAQATRIDWRIAATVVDGLACKARLVMVATPQFEAPVSPPGDAPVAPPLVVGVLGGALLTRFWLRGRSSPGATPVVPESPPPAPRVTMDIPRVTTP